MSRARTHATNNSQMVTSYVAGCPQPREWVAVVAGEEGKSCMTVSDYKQVSGKPQRPLRHRGDRLSEDQWFLRRPASSQGHQLALIGDW